MNSLIPYEYLKYVMESMRDMGRYTDDAIDKLLPWSKELPDYVRKPAEQEL